MENKRVFSGDHAKCTNVTLAPDKLSFGKLYEILVVDKGLILIRDDNKDLSWFAVSGFDIIPRYGK